MKKLYLSIALLFLPALSQAMPADSARVPRPFDKPFVIRLVANVIDSNIYQNSYPSYDTVHSAGPNIVLDTITVDPFDSIIGLVDTSFFTFRDSTLIYSHHRTWHPNDTHWMDSVTFSFNSSLTHIKKLRYMFYKAEPAGDDAWTYYDKSFVLHDLSFDSSGIFISDSNYYAHFDTIWDNSGSPGWAGVGYWSKRITEVRTIELSGIFKNTKFSNPYLSVERDPAVSKLSFTQLNDGLQFNFERAFHNRTLEIYSLLGQREAALQVPAGNVNAVLPMPPAGFYLMRLGSEVRKIYISE